MNGKKLKQSIYTIVFMVIITAICVASVSYLYNRSLKKIRLNDEMFTKQAVLEAAGLLPEGKKNAEELNSIFDENITEKKVGEETVYFIKGGGYVIPVTGTGLWGKIDGVVGLENNLKTLTGVSFIKNEETPGLGARITEKWFCTQFKGKTGPMDYVAEGTKGKQTEFDGITGATITTRAVQNMVNTTLKDAPEIIKEVKNG